MLPTRRVTVHHHLLSLRHGRQRQTPEMIIQQSIANWMKPCERMLSYLVVVRSDAKSKRDLRDMGPPVMHIGCNQVCLYFLALLVCATESAMYPLICVLVVLVDIS